MSLFDFIQDAGKKVADEVSKSMLRPELLTNELQQHDLKVDDLKIAVEQGKVTVSGKVASQELREKVVLVLGNVNGVAQVRDDLLVENAEPESVFYTVKKGDTLSKIAKAHYGNPMKYTDIFEANKPMLKNPDRIYPGQTLRIPKLPVG